MLTLLKARSVAYRSSQRWQLSQIGLVVALPFLAGLAAIFYPVARPYTVSLTIILTLLDALVLDREFRRLTREAAVIGDKFDTELFKLGWNFAAAGAPPKPEAIIRAARSWKGDEAELCNRYPQVIDAVPFAVARALCQRCGAWYDAELRKGFGSQLAVFGGVTFSILTAIGFARGLTLAEWLLSVLAPSAPILIWVIRSISGKLMRRRRTSE